MGDIPTTPFDTLPPTAQRNLSILIAEYRRISAEILSLSLSSGLDSLISSRDDLATTIKELALTLDVRKVPCYFIRMSRTSVSINPTKLAERGVGIDIIEYATERKESKPWVEILEPEHEDEDINLSAFD